MSDKVSIIIVTYNSIEHIPACLDSLQVQNYDPVEIIVYDNASTDGTRDYIHCRHSGVRLIEGESNIGFAAANNEAARLAQGELLAFLNPDTIVEPDWLAFLTEALSADSTIGAVTSQIVFADDPATVNSSGNELHFSGIPYCRNFGRPATTGPPHEVGAISGAAFVTHRELFLRLGGFEPAYFMYMEDTDFSFRLRGLGYRCVAVPRSRVRHAYDQSLRAKKIYYLERNRYMLILSLLDWRVLFCAVASILLVEVVVWVFSVSRGRQVLMAKVYAWRDIVRMRAWIWHRRRTLVAGLRDWRSQLAALNPRLNVDYVGGASKLAFRLLELASYLSAMPALVVSCLTSPETREGRIRCFL